MDLTEMIELGDSDELLREIDRLCDRHDWDGLFRLREACRRSVERGKQLWGAAAHAEYRLALHGPASLAAAVLDSTPGRFALGPLPEVAAFGHQWTDLDQNLPPGPTRGLTAYECVARGADLSAHRDLAPYVESFELPLALQAWEPRYAVAEYKATEALFPSPNLTSIERKSVVPAAGSPLTEPEAIAALLLLTETWVSESNGAARALAVEGGLPEASAVFGLDGLEMARVPATEAMALMAWAGASGGAHGRRSGAAAGRSKAWWALAGVAGLVDDWPVHPDELGQCAEGLEWWTADSGSSVDGWSLRLAAVDHIDGVAFSIDAHDAVTVRVP